MDNPTDASEPACGGSTTRVRRYVGAKGVELVGDVGGDPSALPVVLLHGGGQTRHSWGRALGELIERGYRVINLDARGHGDSAWAQDGDYTLHTLADDLARVLDTLPSPPALVGASMGGATALFLAGMKDAPKAAALVLVDIVPRVDASGVQRIASFMRSYERGFATLEEAEEAVATYNPNRRRSPDLSGLMKNLRRRDDGRLYWHWDPRLLARSDPAEPPNFATQLSQAADRVRLPTLLVRGKQSDLVTDEGVADLKRHIPHLEVFDVAGAGHMVAGDKNDAFNQGVLEFLQRTMRRPDPY